MATSGSFNTNKVGNFYFTFSWERAGYSTTGNYNTIRYSLVAHNTTGNYRTVYAKTLTIAGKTVYNNSTGQAYYDGNGVTSGEIDISCYNEQGNGSMSVTFDAGVGISPGTNCSGSESWEFDQIPRKTTITKFDLEKNDETSVKFTWAASDACDEIKYSINDGDWIGGVFPTTTISGLSAGTQYSIKIKVKRADNQLWTESETKTIITYSYPYIITVGTANLSIGNSQTLTLYNPLGRDVTVRMNQNSNSGTLLYSGSTSETSITFTPDKATLYKSIPDSNSGKAVYSVDYSGTRSTTGNYTYNTVLSECNPIFNDFIYKDTNETTKALTGDDQIIIKGYSNIYGYVSAENKAIAQNSATITDYKFIIGTKTNFLLIIESSIEGKTTFVQASGTIENADNNIIDIYAVDSRGNTTLVRKNAVMKEYFDLTIEKAKAERVNSGVGSQVSLSFNGKFWNDNFGDTASSIKNTIKNSYYEYKETSAEEWTVGETALKISTDGNNFECSGILIKGDKGAEGFDINKSYNFIIGISDELSTREYSFILGAGDPAIAIYENNVSLGGQYDTSIGGRVQLHGDIVSDNFDTIPVGTIQQFAGTETPNTWLLCDGSAISREAYSELYNVIGTTYGDGDGSTTFNLPNLKGKVPVGLDDDDTDFNSLGKTGGEKTEDLRALIGATDGQAQRIGYSAAGAVPMTHYSNYLYAIDGSLSTNRTAISHSTSVFRSDGEYPNTLQPYIVVNYIIKVSTTIGIIKTSTAKVIDNLESESTTDALSANQGRILNEKIKDVYSTEETKTNKVWIDGKPIYRKYVTLGSIGYQTSQLISGSYDTIISWNGNIVNSAGTLKCGLVDRTSSNWRNFTYNLDYNELYVLYERDSTSSWSDWICNVWFEYTKTTD